LKCDYYPLSNFPSRLRLAALAEQGKGEGWEGFLTLKKTDF